MPSWFSKVFKETDLGTPARAGTEAPREEVSLNDYEDEEEFMELRRVVQALVVVDEEETSGWSADVRIKAKYDPVEDKYTLLVDRPVLEGLSFWCPDPETAYAQSPL
ncbi:MAG: hypothetical protein HYZ00_08050, partial [Candidatus Hydrogenedentes bacterium]|nr:hypothetical protein [Candidatus Hydrogenedentota bacterium]